jgi:hypothetical protein
LFVESGIYKIERAQGVLTVPFWSKDKKEGDKSGRSARSLIDDLSEIGLFLDTSVTDSSTAFLGGLLKANLRFAYANFKKGQVDEAISGINSIIEKTTTTDLRFRELLGSHPAYWKVVGAAFYVLGLCHESKNMMLQAVEDYESAVKLHPEFFPAKDRLRRARCR